MPTENPYDSLGRIMAAGGDRPLTIASAGGMPLIGLIALTRARFPGLSEEDSVILAELAESQARAGSLLTNRGGGGSVEPEVIPLNRGLYGDNPQGRRVQVVAEVVYQDEEQGTERKTKVAVDFGHIPTLEEINAEILKQIEEIYRQYPERYGQNEPGNESDAQIQILSASRRY